MMCDVEGLRPDQVALLAQRRERSRDVLDALLAEVELSRGLPDSDAQAFSGLLRSPPDLRVACVISVLAAEHERLGAAAAAAESDDPRADALRALEAALAGALEGTEPLPNPMLVMGIALDKLQARRLPFSASDVELMLDLGLDRTAFWLFPLTVAAAERVLSVEPGNPPVLSALERAAGRLDDHWRGHYDSDLRAARMRIRALVAASSPGGLLDLSVVQEGDAWAEPARAAMVAHAGRWEGVQDVLAHLASTRGSKPTKAWAVRAAQLLEAHSDAASLFQELLELVLEIEVVPTPDVVAWPPRWLLAPGNETLLKGAAWSLRFVCGDWVVPLLGRLALRGAARSPDDIVTTPLSASVANAAVDTLIALATAEGEAELRRLLYELRRRDLLKRIAAALDESPAETASRDEAIRREKKRAVREKANPRPAAEQRDASTRVRTELAPRLWDLGFTSRSGRTFWRRHVDRIEVLHVASKRGVLSVEAGVWFAAPRRRREPPIPDGELCPSFAQCDLQTRLAPDDLADSALRAEGWFLRFEDRAGVLAFLLSDENEDVAGAPGSPVRDWLIGYLAPHAGRPELAAEHLGRAAAFYREQLEARRDLAPGDMTPDWESWVEGLEADAAAAA